MARKLLILGILCVASGFGAATAAADWGPTQVQVYCYAGSRMDNELLGTVDVFDVRKANSSCNMMYADCYYACTACYQDPDSRELCIDSGGRAAYF